MLRHIQLSALAAGIFAGYVVPLLIGVLLLVQLYGAVEQQNAELGRRLFATAVMVNPAGSLVGGYVAASVARFQPLLHGLLTAVVGIALISPFRGVSLVWSACFLAGGIAGAWLRARR